MTSTLSMLGVLSKGRLSHQTASSSNSSQNSHIKPRPAQSDDEFSVSSPTLDDNGLIIEEPSYTIIPKSDDNTDIDQEWTDIGAEDRARARAKAEERKKRELKERQERELQERKQREEEWRIREEEREKAEQEHKRVLEEHRLQEEKERKQREEEDRRRKEEEQRKREEAERKLRENYETASRTREDRAREAERKKQEALRAQERQKLERAIQERDEREQALQERLNVLEDEQQVFGIQICELMEHTEFLKNQNRVLQDRLDRQLEQRTFKDHVRDSSTQRSRFLNNNSVKTSKAVEQEIVMLLDILNSEVYQAAACIADLLESRSQLPMTSGPSAVEESRLTKVIGKGLTEVLKARAIEGAEFDPLIVQVALQMCMNHCCAKIIKSWCPGMWNYSDFLSTLYAGIRANEDLATANKWRSVTHAQFRQNENTKTSMTQFLTEHLMTLLTFIGLPDSSKGWVTELLEERCPIITGPALHINNAIFEDAGSDRLDIVLVRPEELFDNFTMENSFGRNGDTGEVVVATTDLGFRRIAGDYLAVSHLLKPKVVLSSAFDAQTRHLLEQLG